GRSSERVRSRALRHRFDRGTTSKEVLPRVVRRWTRAGRRGRQLGQNDSDGNVFKEEPLSILLRVQLHHEARGAHQGDDFVHGGGPRRYSRSVISRFTPQAGTPYKFELEIYKGFDDDRRNIARRLYRPAYYQTITVRLDLTRYLEGEYELARKPELSTDNRYDVSASNDHFEKTTVAEQNGSVWRWELHDIREGVVRVTWDVQPKKNSELISC